MGDQMEFVDYSSQVVSIGELNCLIIDFGENLPLVGKLRTSLSEGEKAERNQCAALHLAAAYEWAPQGCPRMPPSLSRVQTVVRYYGKRNSKRHLDA